MPTENTPVEVMLTVERNNTTINFLKEKKTRGDVVRTPDAKGNVDQYYLLKGSEYPSPEVTEANFVSTVIPWFGLKNIVKIVAAKADQWAQNLTEEVLEQREGLFDNETFAALAAQFSPRGEPMSELLKTREDLLMKFESATTPEEQTALMGDIKAIMTAIRSKKRVTKEEKAAAANA
jgi:hypothetical protein